MKKKRKKSDYMTNVRNAHEKAVNVARTIEATVQIGTNTPIVDYLFLEWLPMCLTFGWDFSEAQMECIKPRLTIIEMDDDSTVPLIHQKRKPNMKVPLHGEQFLNMREPRKSSIIKTKKQVK